MENAELKKEVASYWNKGACGTNFASSDKYTKEYFEEIEAYRYRVEPEIFPFAQFTRHRGQKILEVGVGAGSDFTQWVRAGAKAYGVDLTKEAVEHVTHRLALYGLAAEEVKVADSENLPFPDNSFDLVYSWGVIHHSPDTPKAFAEIVRCTKNGGAIKIMLYNKRSLHSLYMYLRHGLFKGHPFRTVSDIMYNHQESIGTKVYTIAEMKEMVSRHPVDIVSITARATYYDLLGDRNPLFRAVAYVLACLAGFNRCGWFVALEMKKRA